jgi:hypothetical protein
LLGATLTAACSRPLPEEGTPAALLYAQRCGGCHAVYRPELLTAGMWSAMVDRMEIELRRRGRPLDAGEKTEILAYLQRNASVR